MRMIKVLGVTTLLFLMSCSGQPAKIRHKYIIPRDKFVDILVDIHLMDAITNGPEFYRKFSAEDSVNVYSEIFKKFGVSRAQFDSTMVSYTRRPELYLKIYDDVILRLNFRIDELKDKKPSFKKEEEEKPPKNS